MITRHNTASHVNPSLSHVSLFFFPSPLNRRLRLFSFLPRRIKVGAKLAGHSSQEGDRSSLSLIPPAGVGINGLLERI